MNLFLLIFLMTLHFSYLNDQIASILKILNYYVS